MLPRRERPCTRERLRPVALAGKQAEPRAAEKFATCEKFASLELGLDALERHPDRRRRRRGCTTIATCPPGAVTRASSSKNGIMLFIVTSSNAPSSYGSARRVGDVVALRLRRREPPRLADHLGRDVGADDLGLAATGPRRAARRRRCRCRGRGRCAVRARHASSAARIAPSEISCDARRVPLGREPVEVPRQRPAEDTPERGDAHDDRGHEPREPLAERHGRAIRISSPADTPVSRAASPLLIASVTSPYESSYRISSPGGASANVLRDDGVVTVERQPDLDAVAVRARRARRRARDARSWRRCRTGRRSRRSRRSACARPPAPARRRARASPDRAPGRARRSRRRPRDARPPARRGRARGTCARRSGSR